MLRSSLTDDHGTRGNGVFDEGLQRHRTVSVFRRDLQHLPKIDFFYGGKGWGTIGFCEKQGSKMYMAPAR